MYPQYQPHLFTAPFISHISPIHSFAFKTNNIPIALDSISIPSHHYSECSNPSQKNLSIFKFKIAIDPLSFILPTCRNLWQEFLSGPQVPIDSSSSCSLHLPWHFLPTAIINLVNKSVNLDPLSPHLACPAPFGTFPPTLALSPVPLQPSHPQIRFDQMVSRSDDQICHWCIVHGLCPQETTPSLLQPHSLSPFSTDCPCTSLPLIFHPWAPPWTQPTIFGMLMLSRSLHWHQCHPMVPVHLHLFSLTQDPWQDNAAPTPLCHIPYSQANF